MVASRDGEGDEAVGVAGRDGDGTAVYRRHPSRKSKAQITRREGCRGCEVDGSGETARYSAF